MSHRKKLLINDLPVATWQKMVRLREAEGFGLRTWGDWLAFVFRKMGINETDGDRIYDGVVCGSQSLGVRRKKRLCLKSQDDLGVRRKMSR